MSTVFYIKYHLSQFGLTSSLLWLIGLSVIQAETRHDCAAPATERLSGQGAFSISIAKSAKLYKVDTVSSGFG